MNEFARIVAENEAKKNGEVPAMSPADHVEVQMLTQRVAQYQTSHLLHLVLSLVTAGVWVPVWILVTLSNAIERSRLRRKILKIGENYVS